MLFAREEPRQLVHDGKRIVIESGVSLTESIPLAPSPEAPDPAAPPAPARLGGQTPESGAALVVREVGHESLPLVVAEPAADEAADAPPQLTHVVPEELPPDPDPVDAA
jgi:hypothetical protein